MNSEHEVRNRLQAIESLSSELNARLHGTSEEQHAFWLMVDCGKLDEVEKTLFDLACRIATEMGEQS
jgi:hypothetical protein